MRILTWPLTILLVAVVMCCKIISNIKKGKKQEEKENGLDN
jgi:hypothetical protein